MNVNKVLIAGRLTRAPELRYTPKGTPVARVSLAVNRSWKGEDGQKKEEVTFIHCEAWSVTAETMAKHLKTGSTVFIEGRLKLQTWEKDGTTQSKLSVVIESFQFGDKKPGSDPAKPKPSAPATEPEPPEDDVLF